jgi:hypothetical protein
MPPRLKLMVVEGILKWFMTAADMLGVGLLHSAQRNTMSV